MQRQRCNPAILAALVCSVLLPGLTGCGNNPSQKLVGTWTSYEPDGGAGVQGAIDKGMNKVAAKFEFADLGKVVFSPAASESHVGTWQVVRTEGDRMIVEVSIPKEPGETPQTTQIAVDFQDDDRITMQQVGGGDDTRIEFVRS
jgi:hypothetical protein